MRRLPGHLGDEFEIGVIVEYNESLVLGDRGDEQVGHLAPPKVPVR